MTRAKVVLKSMKTVTYGPGAIAKKRPRYINCYKCYIRASLMGFLSYDGCHPLLEGKAIVPSMSFITKMVCCVLSSNYKHCMRGQSFHPGFSTQISGQIYLTGLSLGKSSRMKSFSVAFMCRLWASCPCFCFSLFDCTDVCSLIS